MTTTTPPMPKGCAIEGGTPQPGSACASRAPSVAPENAPDSTPTSVMPIWTEDRNRPGSSARRSAMAAPRLPRSAMTFTRAGRAETMASSDMAKSPFTRIRIRTMAISNHIGRALEQLKECRDKRAAWGRPACENFVDHAGIGGMLRLGHGAV